MTRVTPVRGVWRVKMYVLCLVMVLSGPGFLALGLLLDANVWACLAIAAALSLVLVPLGVRLARDARRAVSQRRLAERSRAGS